MAVRAEFVTKPAVPAKATGRPTHGTPEGTRGVAGPQGKSKEWQGGAEGPFTTATIEMMRCREVLKRFNYGLERMNHLGQELWANSHTNIFMEPSGTWSSRRKRDGKPFGDGLGGAALEQFLTERAVQIVNLADMIRDAR